MYSHRPLTNVIIPDSSLGSIDFNLFGFRGDRPTRDGVMSRDPRRVNIFTRDNIINR